MSEELPEELHGEKVVVQRSARTPLIIFGCVILLFIALANRHQRSSRPPSESVASNRTESVALAAFAPNKKKYIGQWRSASGGRLIISDNGPSLLIYDPRQPDTFTAIIDSTGDLQDSHGRKLPYIYGRNHILYLGGEYEKVSDDPNAVR